MIMRPFLMLALLRLSCHGYGYGAHDHHPLWGKAVRVRPDAIQSEPNRQRPGLFFSGLSTGQPGTGGIGCLAGHHLNLVTS
uniref:Secreted peptide n=1 Tax=Anopheles braziliensis TaxID=58242 RepID=A0A2M3ZLM4_9DIPT